MDAVSEVLDRRNALETARVRVFLDLFDDLLGSHHVGQLGDDDAHLAGRHTLDLDLRACLERAAARLVGFFDTFESDDDAALRQVGAGNVAHEVGDGRRRVVQQMNGTSDRLGKIVRGDIRRHTHGDARGAVDQELRECGRQDVGLHELVVVVGDEIDRVLVQARHQVQRGGCHARFGVTRCGRTVIQRPEVTVSIHQGNPQIERLSQTHQGLVNRGIAVRVQLTHDLADDALRLHVPLVGTQPHLIHLEHDAALHGLEAVARVGQRSGVDDGDRVLQEGSTHLIGHVDLGDIFVFFGNVDDLVLFCHRRNYDAGTLSFRLGRRLGAQLWDEYLDPHRTKRLLPARSGACATPSAGSRRTSRDAVSGGHGLRPGFRVPSPHRRFFDRAGDRPAARRRDGRRIGDHRDGRAPRG